MSLHLEKFIHVDKTYFLLTAYTGGSFVNEKKNHTLNYIKQIRKYYPNSYIVLVDSIPNEEISNVCDLYVCELLNNNIPHGQGDLDKIKIGLNILKGLGATNVIRSAYDYWMDDNIFNRSQEWIQLLDNGCKIISSHWRGTSNDPLWDNTISSGYGCYNVEAALNLFNFDKIDPVIHFLEVQLHQRLTNMYQPHEYFIYETCFDMFNSHTYDIFNFAGTIVHQERLNSTL